MHACRVCVYESVCVHEVQEVGWCDTNSLHEVQEVGWCDTNSLGDYIRVHFKKI